MNGQSAAILRPARKDDARSLARLWHDAWHDAHARIVPEQLVMARVPGSFSRRIVGKIPTCTIAEIDGEPVGFCVITGEELESMFVDKAARGTGVAELLMADGEVRLGEKGVVTAQLYCVHGNDRAYRFYEKNGWVDIGDYDDIIELRGGTVTVPCHHFEKKLR